MHKAPAVQTFSLSVKMDGIDRRLELVRDPRLTGKVLDSLWGKGGWEDTLPSDSNLYREFSSTAPKAACLLLRDGSGKVVAKKAFNTPYVKVTDIIHGEGKNTFFVSEDHSIGMGSYAGIETSLISVNENGFAIVTAKEVGGSEEKPILLVSTLKSGWKLIKGEQGLKIFEVSTEPDGSGDFMEVYKSYICIKGQWFVRTRMKKGYWESDMPFPSLSEFESLK